MSELTPELRNLRLHFELYSRQAVTATCEVFAVCADIKSTENAPYFHLALTAKDGADIDEITNEFGNYVLGLTIEERRSGQ